MVRGAGTALNICTVLIGAGVGIALSHRLPKRTREVVTDGLGLVTLLVAATSAATVLGEPLTHAVGSGAAVLVVLASIVIGGVSGSLLRLEERLEHLADLVRRRLARAASDGPDAAGGATRDRFVDGFVNASLVFCVGPLTILGALDDGLGRGIDKLALKATLDGFASIAFAASYGWGVAASVLPIAAIQGPLTALGWALGDVLDAAQIQALTATGGLLLAGVALRLLKIKQLPVGDLLPALVVAPLLVHLVEVVR